MLPDEGWYYTTFIVQPIGFSVYRPIMNLAYVIFFSGVSSLDGLFVWGAIYCAVWAIGSVWMLSKVLRVLAIEERPAALTLLTFMVLPIFPIMAVFFVTETMALFFIFAGIYFSLKYLKGGAALSAAAAATMFLFASSVREPYILFVIVVPFVLFAMRFRLKALLAYAAIAVISLPVPVSIVPFNIGLPVATFIFSYLPNLVLHGGQPAFPSYVYVAGTTLPVATDLSGVYAFLVGAAYGIGPVFGLLTLISLVYAVRAKSKASYLVLLFSLLSIVSYLVTADLAVAFQSDAATVWTSDLIRLSSSALPAAIGLGYLYSKVDFRIVRTAFLVTIAFGVLAAGAFSSALQSTQDIQGSTVDRLSLSYRAPYLTMYQTAQPGSLILSGGSGIGTMTVFASFLDNVTVKPIPPNGTAFGSLLAEGWSHVYLYDDWVTLNASFIARCDCYPTYYASLILYGNWTLLWSNSESYALEMKP
jgi:hypothetical protein